MDPPDDPIDLPLRPARGQDAEDAIQPSSVSLDQGGKSVTSLTNETDNNGANDGNEDDEATMVDVELMGPKKKKKSKRKPKSKRGRVSPSGLYCPPWFGLTLRVNIFQNKPTGFEEYYVDAPITPQQFEEEKSIYDR